MGKWQLVVLCIAVLASALIASWMKILPVGVMPMLFTAMIGWIAPSPVLADISKQQAAPGPVVPKDVAP